MSEKMQYPVRITVDTVKDFKAKCKKYDRYHYEVARELLQAYAEDRVTINPTIQQKDERRKLYHESGK